MSSSKTLGTRRRLIDAAQKRLLRGNADDVTLRKVAKDAGVSPAAVYRHFPDKDALIEEITMAAIERFEQSLWREIASLPVGSIERLTRLGEAYIRFAASNPGDFDALFTPSKAGPRPLDRFSGGVGYTLLVQCVREAMEFRRFESRGSRSCLTSIVDARSRHRSIVEDGECLSRSCTGQRRGWAAQCICRNEPNDF